MVNNKAPKKHERERPRREGDKAQYIDVGMGKTSCRILARKRKARWSIDCKFLELMMTGGTSFSD